MLLSVVIPVFNEADALPIVALQFIFSGATLWALGLIGNYIARIYEEAKGRPLYVVSETLNLRSANTRVERAITLPARSSYDAAEPELPRKMISGI